MEKTHSTPTGGEHVNVIFLNNSLSLWKLLKSKGTSKWEATIQ